MASVEERRKAEFPQYERPAYYGVMKPWRTAIICEWAGRQWKGKARSWLDVGCGPGETQHLARALWFDEWRGCEVVESVCGPDVDLIPGAHALPYDTGSYDIVTANDVMEHILEEDVPAALYEMHRVARRGVLLGISQVPGPHHPTIKSTEWWIDRIIEAMPGRNARECFADRVPEIKRPYLWVEVTNP